MAGRRHRSTIRQAIVMALALFPWAMASQGIAPADNQSAALEIQVLLDRARYSPGEIDGVIGYVKGQKPDVAAAKRHSAAVNFTGVTLDTIRQNTHGMITP